MEANHTKRSYKKKKESQTFYLACQILLVSEWKVVSPLLSPQSHSHVPGGGHPEEHLRPAVHRERAVEEVSDGYRDPLRDPLCEPMLCSVAQ